MTEEAQQKDYAQVLPGAVLAAMRHALEETFGLTGSGQDVIYAQSGLLGDYVAFVRHGFQYAVLQAIQVNGQRSLSEEKGRDRRNRLPSWKITLLRTYTPPDPDWGDPEYVDMDDL